MTIHSEVVLQEMPFLYRDGRSLSKIPDIIYYDVTGAATAKKTKAKR